MAEFSPKYEKGYCVYCGIKLRKANSFFRKHDHATKDHYLPKSLGYRITVPCCHFCNQAKWRQMPEDWLRSSELILRRENVQKAFKYQKPWDDLQWHLFEVEKF